MYCREDILRMVCEDCSLYIGHEAEECIKCKVSKLRDRLRKQQEE